MDMIKLHILSPEGSLVQTTAEAVTLPGVVCPFMVLKDHAPLVTALVAGDICWRTEGKEYSQPIREGFVEVRSNTVSCCVEV